VDHENVLITPGRRYNDGGGGDAALPLGNEAYPVITGDRAMMNLVPLSGTAVGNRRRRFRIPAPARHALDFLSRGFDRVGYQPALASNRVHCFNNFNYLLFFFEDFFFFDDLFAFFFAAMINPLLVKLNDTRSKYHVYLYTSQIKTVQTLFHTARVLITQSSNEFIFVSRSVAQRRIGKT
jgi:hypothetical protein